MTEGQLCPPHGLWKDELQAVPWSLSRLIYALEVLLAIYWAIKFPGNTSKENGSLAGRSGCFPAKEKRKMLQEDLNPVGIY